MAGDVTRAAAAITGLQGAAGKVADAFTLAPEIASPASCGVAVSNSGSGSDSIASTASGAARPYAVCLDICRWHARRREQVLKP